MRSQTIPAQITTVEDKIAGSLNFAQILLIMVPVIWGTLVYSLFPIRMQLSLYKIPLVLIVAVLCLVLAIRIRGKIIFQWLIVILRFNLRPKHYIYNKNESYLRTIDLPVFENKQYNLLKFIKSKSKTKVSISYPKFEIKELAQLERLIDDPSISLSFKTNGIGGKLNVALEQNQQ